MRILVSLSLILLVLQADQTGRNIKVPQNSPAVMVDGVLSEGEWRNAAHAEVPSTADLYFQESSEFVYVAVKYTNSPSGIVDLYLSPRNEEVYDLHASAKLGERQLQGNKFSDWTWWNNREWTANISPVDSFDKRTFLPTPIREYQIRRSRFSSHVWRVRFELTAMKANHETQSVTVFPSGTTDTSTAGWLVLTLP
jgi:hypothetical protein